jgi:hypothetical protein
MLTARHRHDHYEQADNKCESQMSHPRVIPIEWEAQAVEWTWTPLKRAPSLPRTGSRRLLLPESSRPGSFLEWITLSRKSDAAYQAPRRQIRFFSSDCSCHRPKVRGVAADTPTWSWLLRTDLRDAP